LIRTLNARLYRQLHSSRLTATFHSAVKACSVAVSFGCDEASVEPARQSFPLQVFSYPRPELFRLSLNPPDRKERSQPKYPLAGRVALSSFDATDCDTIEDTKQKVGRELSSDSPVFRSNPWSSSKIDSPNPSLTVKTTGSIHSASLPDCAAAGQILTAVRAIF